MFLVQLLDHFLWPYLAFRCQFHKHFTQSFLYESALRSFSLITVWLCNFLAKGYCQKKLLVKSWWNWLRKSRGFQLKVLVLKILVLFHFANQLLWSIHLKVNGIQHSIDTLFQMKMYGYVVLKILRKSHTVKPISVSFWKVFVLL
jgi:hypothetical protein